MVWARLSEKARKEKRAFRGPKPIQINCEEYIMENQITTANSSNVLEQVVIGGDLSSMSPADRVSYYRTVCESLGLNPFTRPFDYLKLNGKLTLYAKKDATEQLRALKGISIDDLNISESGDNYTVIAKGHDASGRSDIEIGVVSKRDMQGNTANAQMKAVTKAKRRLTLSLAGLGWLDESEIDSISDAKPVQVTDDGVIVEEPKLEAKKFYKPAETQATYSKPYFPGEDEFLTAFVGKAEDFPIDTETAMGMKDSNGEAYTDKSTETLFYMRAAIEKRLQKNHLTEAERDALKDKIAAINVIFANSKAFKGL